MAGLVKEQEEHTIDIASFKLYIPHNTWKFHITPELLKCIKMCIHDNIFLFRLPILTVY